jgi:predicted Zn-dependent peptidase
VLDASETVFADLEKLASVIPWSKNNLSLPAPADPEVLAANGSREPYIVDLPREQSAVICLVPGVFAHSREFYALLIADAALNGLASNLFNEVREKRSLAYSTGAVVTCGLVQGIIALHAGVKMENAAAALNCLQQEIDRLGSCGLDKAEFEAAKLSALSSLARQMESADARLMHAQLGLFYGEEPQKSLQCCDILSDISFEECNTILNKVFNSAPMACVIAGAVKNKC